MALRYCPNGECVNFQYEVDTEKTRCSMCAWDLVPVKKENENSIEEQPASDSEAA